MKDPFGRKITYLRVSVTDRCNFRCTYCMAEDMVFLPKADILSLEELDRICTAFVHRGVRKLRLSGGEPLVRRGVMSLFRSLGRHLDSGDLDELTLTTNATQLAKHAAELFDCGVRRVNVSMDTLDPKTFDALTRGGRLHQVLEGVEAAASAGLGVKINTVALRGVNETEIPDLVGWCGQNGFDLTLIETMPMGEIDADRTDYYLPLAKVREQLQSRWTLTDIPETTGGPSTYVSIGETGKKVGFITPMSHNFCESCNRVRLTCTGKLYMCLGQDDHVDLRAAVREAESDGPLMEAIDKAIAHKPKGHDFVIDPATKTPSVQRHMNVTGG
ncbi:MAG: GTP 3',8-cyclase MoaA [Rhodospirillales bacterium]|nr:GTP 3',8-cyclase MoaA [Rhodospirillales bacterium]